MKFRYKVLLINIVIISLAISVAGTVMMSRMTNLMIDEEIRNSVTENNLVQSVIEYSLLDIINNNPTRIGANLPEIANQVSAGILNENSELYISFEEDYIFTTDKETEQNSYKNIPDFTNTENTSSVSNVDYTKKYIIIEEGRNLFIYTSSFGLINDSPLRIVTRRDITGARDILNKNLNEMRIFMISMIALSGLLIYIISFLLTKPLEKLNRVTDDFAGGDFSIRSDIKTSDEVGLLSDKFNHMADSVENHIDELNDMLRRRDQFVADFTHEIKTPMTTIIGYADTIRSVELPREDEVMAADYIFSEGKRLEQMSSHLFDLIYLKDGHVEKTKVNTLGIGEAVKETVMPAMLKKKIRLESRFDSASIIADSALLRTAFINLLDNARKASAEGSSISFYGEMNENSAGYRFVVEDHGIGIAPEDVNRICDEFYMVDKSRSRKEGGAGLGMSLVAAILKEHGATLKIESKLGTGTKMIVEFTTCNEEESDNTSGE